MKDPISVIEILIKFEILLKLIFWNRYWMNIKIVKKFNHIYNKEMSEEKKIFKYPKIRM